MPTAYSIDHEGRRIEVVPDSLWEKDRVRLLIDGETVAESKTNGPKTVLSADGVEVRIVMPLWGGSVTRAELVVPGADPVRLEPEPGTRAARRRRLELERPALFAARHFGKGVAKAALAVVGIGFLLGIVLPAIPWPSIDLPDISIPIPEIPLPSIDLPSIELPGWVIAILESVGAILESKQYWLPILIGLVLAVREWQRRERRRDRAPAEPLKP